MLFKHLLIDLQFEREFNFMCIFCIDFIYQNFWVSNFYMFLKEVSDVETWACLHFKNEDNDPVLHDPVVEIMAETIFHTMFSMSQSLFALDEGVSLENVGMWGKNMLQKLGPVYS